MKSVILKTHDVNAILNDTKTQFRMLIKLKDNTLTYTGYVVNSTDKKRCGKCSFGIVKERDLEYVKPKYKVDDILYVKETFCYDRDGFAVFKSGFVDIPFADGAKPKWKPSVHLKQKDARIFLKVTNIRVERLNDITVQDIIQEGYYNFDCTNHSKPHYFANMTKKWWINLWNSTAKDGYRWEDNPYAFVYEFERVNLSEVR